MRASDVATIRLPVMLVAFAVGACTSDGRDREAPSSIEAEPTDRLDPIAPIVPETALDARKVSLGKRLFHDKALSDDGRSACASCHDVRLGMADGQPRPNLPGRPEGLVNTPTIWNVAHDASLNWSGQFVALEDQAAAAIVNPMAMAGSWPALVTRLRAASGYAAAFSAIYREGITPLAVADAIAAYERSLDTPNAPFDRWLRGDEGALTPDEREGYGLFKRYGCVSCHQGVNVGGNMFQRFGVMGDYFADRGRDVTAADLGRFSVTHDEHDRFVFRVPSLRNVARTAPYLHDGSAATLEEAVAVMGRYQIGRRLSAREVSQIVAFLGSLNGQVGGEAP